MYVVFQQVVSKYPKTNILAVHISIYNSCLMQVFYLFYAFMEDCFFQIEVMLYSCIVLVGRVQSKVTYPMFLYFHSAINQIIQ